MAEEKKGGKFAPAVEMGKLGGKVTSAPKREASVENGQKGGRPAGK